MQAQQKSTTAARNPELWNPLSAFDNALGSRTSEGPGLTQAPTRPTAATTAALTHDAGNILAALSLYCDLLEAPGVLAPQHLHYAAELRNVARRSGALLHQAVAAPHRGPATEAVNHAVACDPAATLRALLPVLNGVARPAEVTLQLPANGNPILSPALPAQHLERIVLNLVRNAAQAIAAQPDRSPLQRGRITVSVAAASGFMRLSVQDNGPGLPPALAARFLRPQPLRAGATRGLGHRIVHELATATGGSLSLRVKPRLGTTISIKWPLAAAEGRPC